MRLVVVGGGRGGSVNSLTKALLRGCIAVSVVWWTKRYALSTTLISEQRLSSSGGGGSVGLPSGSFSFGVESSHQRRHDGSRGLLGAATSDEEGGGNVSTPCWCGDYAGLSECPAQYEEEEEEESGYRSRRYLAGGGGGDAEITLCEGSLTLVQKEVLTMIALFTVVVCITILFEWLKEILIDRTADNMQEIMTRLFGEMTVLGFISIITFIVNVSGWLAQVSAKVFEGADHASEKLLHSLEYVHFGIFFMMVFFITQVCIILASMKRTEAKWYQWQALCPGAPLGQNTELVIKTRKFSGSAKDGMVTVKALRKQRSVATLTAKDRSTTAEEHKDKNFDPEAVLFCQLRLEFLRQRSLNTGLIPPIGSPKRLPDDFNFVAYLMECMAEIMADIVELPIHMWAIVLGAAWTLYFVDVVSGHDNKVIGFVWMCGGFSWCLVLASLLRHCKKILSFHTLRGDVISDLATPEIAEKMSPRWTSLNDPSLEDRSRIRSYVFGRAPHKQEKLFWFQANGHEFHVTAIRLTLMGTPFYAAGGAYLAKWMNDGESSTALVAIYFVLVFAPAAYMLLFMSRDFIRILTLVGSIGVHKQPEIVEEVLGRQRKQKICWHLQILNHMRIAWQVEQLESQIARNKNADERGGSAPQNSASDPSAAPSGQSNGKGGDNGATTPGSKKSSSVRPTELLTNRRGAATMQTLLEDLDQRFDIYDVDKSGSIDANELRNLMRSLGHVMSPAQSQDLLAILDSDDDGTVHKTKIIAWLLWEREIGTLDMGAEELGRFVYARLLESAKKSNDEARNPWKQFSGQENVLTIKEMHAGLVALQTRDILARADVTELENQVIEFAFHSRQRERRRVKKQEKLQAEPQPQSKFEPITHGAAPAPEKIRSRSSHSHGHHARLSQLSTDFDSTHTHFALTRKDEGGMIVLSACAAETGEAESKEASLEELHLDHVTELDFVGLLCHYESVAKESGISLMGKTASEFGSSTL